MGVDYSRLGIFAKTFNRPTLGETLDAVCAHPIRIVQFNLSCAGLPTLPDHLEEAECKAVATAVRDRGLTMAAISGTFNPIDPDLARREDNLRKFDVLASKCHILGTRIITLCTGTCDPEDMWRHHPGNAEPEAWDDMAAMMKRIVAIAEAHDVIAAFEPETGNVVDSALRASRLIDEIGSAHLKVVLDPANLFRPGDIPRMAEVLDEAFALLSPHIVLLHAKDVLPDGSGTTAPGSGVLDYSHVFRRFKQNKLWHKKIPVILHGLCEDKVGGSLYCVALNYSYS
ncbi:MAG: Xylose isomerase domain protein barrel [Planctomycetota bacterium]|nr:Xylose isomerase domain protein barrel [Planctomycetota bacterium]